MSILQRPRIYFRGDIAWDPVTTNNYPVGSTRIKSVYDEAHCESVLVKTPVTAADVDDYRSEAVDGITKAGNWNPHGTYRSPFYDTRVSGTDKGMGLDTEDPFVGAHVAFTGMLVDSEPYGAFSSQLFFDDMSFGIEGGCRIYGRCENRFTDRFINFAANPLNDKIAGVASVMWQTCFPRDKLNIDVFDSATLAELSRRIDEESDVRGVMVRFVTQRTVYYGDPSLSNGTEASTAAGKALQAKIASGGFQPNPARSKLVGTVGLWCDEDCPSESSDRALATTKVSIFVSDKAGISYANCGTAFARVSGKTLSLDFSNAIPSADRDATRKVDLGKLIVMSSDPQDVNDTHKVAVIDPSDYAQDAFDATSGIIDIPLDFEGDGLRDRDLIILDERGNVQFAEETWRVVPFDPNFYTHEGQPATAKVRLYKNGRPSDAGVTVVMSVMTPSGCPGAPHVGVKTDGAGWAEFTLPTSPGSVTGYVFRAQPNPNRPPINPGGFGAFDPMIWTYMYHRILPADADIAAMEPTWENVHGHVLANWQAMAPCMDNWLDLGDEQQMKAYAGIVKKLTDPANFEAFRYMPVTRDLTEGQRSLLWRFLDGDTAQVASTAGATAGQASLEGSGAAEVRLAPEPEDPNAPMSELMRLSRSHRAP